MEFRDSDVESDEDYFIDGEGEEEEEDEESKEEKLIKDFVQDIKNGWVG